MSRTRGDCLWPWRTLGYGCGFSIPRRWAGTYMRDPSALYWLARQQGIRVRITRLACGLTIRRVGETYKAVPTGRRRDLETSSCRKAFQSLRQSEAA